jgi:hypothetical protein
MTSTPGPILALSGPGETFAVLTCNLIVFNPKFKLGSFIHYFFIVPRSSQLNYLMLHDVS